ncbi:MAG: hypothetical protein NTW85_06535 [Methylococcales bacterium]|nr:hypothetical protein [Methylococcales bacterium]
MLSDYQTLLSRLVRDDNAVITTTDIDKAIQLAVVRYSCDFPLSKVVDLASNNTNMLPLPVDWTLGISSIASVEYPIGSFPPIVMTPEKYCLYQNPVGIGLLFLFTPDSAVRLTYCVPHTVTTLVDTINSLYREGVVCWAAAWCCDQLSSYYASASDSTIQADHVQRNSQSADYARLAKNYRERYFSELGVEEKKLIASSAVVDLDLQNSRGQDRFSHSNRYR